MVTETRWLASQSWRQRDMHFVYVEKEGTTRYLRNKGNTYGPGQTEDYYE
jgi:hypothetical protein